MINILDNDFDTLLGKLGAWPGDVSSADCAILYDYVSRMPQKSRIAELSPTHGKSTVILSAAARRSGSSLTIVLPPQTQSQWFDRAFDLFGLDLAVVDSLTNIQAPLDLIVARDASSTVAGHVAATGQLIVIGQSRLAKHKLTDNLSLVDIESLSIMESLIDAPQRMLSIVK